MMSHIIGFLLVTLAQIPMPIKIGTTFQNKLQPNIHYCVFDFEAFSYLLYMFVMIELFSNNIDFDFK